ncbi:MFS transporter [Roseateles cellulosilyticus]|uniref:MFS transporter n=1 Tax=Pelomonas cellulosilytica TaxID=2906762 RepID=A0ABS8XQF3_9BURK|nr:MFS transporter [Pelomonas sp. P8]MCE4552899.1 MFS transporter [Pelomonas sp. P8]
MSSIPSAPSTVPSSAVSAEVSEFRRDKAWQVVLAAWVGVAMGLTALPFYTLGIFAKPLAQTFGWSRSVIQSGFTFSMLGVICSAWLAGWAIDRFGVRRVALFSQAGLALGFLGLACQTGSTVLWQANWFLFAVLGIGTTPLTWSRGIGAWFDKRRGMALGIALSGTGVTALVAPPLMNQIVTSHGWRAGYVVVALAIVLFAMPVVWWLFREKPRAEPGVAAGEGEGLSVGQALRTRQFWLLIVAFWIICAVVAGLIPNLVPMLTDAGLSMTEAAGYASLLGINVMFGRLLAGWLLDRFWGPAVALLLLMPPTLACLLLAQQQWPGPAVVMIGLAAGAEFDLIAYLCLRYFGTRNFGQIYAWQWANFSVAAGAGPVGFAMIFDRNGSYHDALLIAAVLLVLGPLLLLGLGRYPKAWPAR